MRLYSVAIASLAVQAPVKWTDNLLSQHPIPEVTRRERGVSRGITWNALVRIALIRELHQGLGCGVREAVSLAARLMEAPALTVDGTGGALTLGFERSALERVLQSRLSEAIESAPRPRRGRPPDRAVRAG
jgi:hypothetical protein